MKVLELLRKQEAETAKWEGESQALTAELQSLRLDLINRDAQIRREEESSAVLSRDLQQVLNSNDNFGSLRKLVPEISPEIV